MAQINSEMAPIPPHMTYDTGAPGGGGHPSQSHTFFLATLSAMWSCLQMDGRRCVQGSRSRQIQPGQADGAPLGRWSGTTHAVTQDPHTESVWRWTRASRLPKLPGAQPHPFSWLVQAGPNHKDIKTPYGPIPVVCAAGCAWYKSISMLQSTRH